MSKVSKRDFFKMLGFSASAVAIHASQLPKDVAVCDLPAANRIEDSSILPGRFDYVLDAKDAIIYDTMEFAPGQIVPHRFRLFQTPWGQTCPYSGKVKGPGDTNMGQAGMMTAPTSFWVKRIHISAPLCESSNDTRLARSYGWSFWLAQKRFADGPCSLDLQTLALSKILKGQTPAIRKSMEFEHTSGLYIPPQMYFAHEFNSTPERECRADMDGNGLKFIVALEGVQWRGVQ